jgi:hypothetical protein
VKQSHRLAALTPLLVLAGCSDILGGSGPRVYLSVGAQRMLPAEVRLHVESDGHTAELATIGPLDEQQPTYFRPGGYGQREVRLELRSASGATITDYAYAQTFPRDSNHWIVVALGTSRPIGLCIGNLAAIPLPAGALDGNPASADSMFVMHGSLPEGAVC